MDKTNDISTSSNYYLNGKIMLCSVTILFIVVCVVVCFHTFGRWCPTRPHHHQQRRLRRRPRQPPNPPPTTTTTTTMNFFTRQNGLDGSILKTIPIFVYSPTTNAAVLDQCAVCLSEFDDGERGRTLPNCGHAFHVACIDAWFWCHTNCPLCRAPANHQPDNTTNVPDHHPVSETGSSDVVVITVIDESPAGVSEQTREAGCSGSLSEGVFQPEWCPRKADGLVGLVATDVGSEENPGSSSPERNRYNESVSLKRI